MTRPDDHRTPDDIFEALSERYGPFDMDVAASSENKKCALYYTKHANALEQHWYGNVWCNPPYHSIDAWAAKAIVECMENKTTVTMLLPSRTDRPWFAKLWAYAHEMHFIQGRLSFTGPHEIKNSCAPQGSIVFYLDGSNLGYSKTHIGFMNKHGDKL